MRRRVIKGDVVVDERFEEVNREVWMRSKGFRFGN